MKLIADNKLTGIGEAIAWAYIAITMATFVGIASATTPYQFDYTLTIVYVIVTAYYCFSGNMRLIKVLLRKYKQLITESL